MGRMYTAMIDGVSVSAPCDLFFLKAPADAVVVLHEVVLTQDASETSEQRPVNIFRTATDNSAQGTANTPAPLQAGDAAFGGTVRTNITGANLAAETTPLFRQSQNALGGWHWLWTPETRPILSPSAGVAVKLDDTPTAALAFSGYIVFEEIGG